jgi:hypothetical protein
MSPGEDKEERHVMGIRKRGWPATIAGLLGALGWSALALAQPYVYPERGQSPQQQQKDRGECHVWAVQQTGFDPANPRVATGPPPAPPTSTAPLGGPSPLRGAARGAAIGSVGGAIAGDAGKGAAIGAATGALFGGLRRADETRQYEQQQAAHQQQQQAAVAQGNDAYNRALAACLAGRGYTVR